MSCISCFGRFSGLAKNETRRMLLKLFIATIFQESTIDKTPGCRSVFEYQWSQSGDNAARPNLAWKSTSAAN
jgi:hypothetical protein